MCSSDLEEIEKSGKGCFYPFCRRQWTHLIEVCPELHSKCCVCINRGHDAEVCMEFTVLEKYSKFMLYKEYGMFTRKAKEEPCWGFSDKFYDVELDLSVIINRDSGEAYYFTRPKEITEVTEEMYVEAKRGAKGV